MLLSVVYILKHISLLSFTHAQTEENVSFVIPLTVCLCFDHIW